MSIAENLLFGMPRDAAFHPGVLASNPEVLALLRDVGLLDDLYAAGAKVAELMVELFADVAPDSDLFAQYSFISSEDLPEFRSLVARIGQRGIAVISERDKARLLALTLRLRGSPVGSTTRGAAEPSPRPARAPAAARRAPTAGRCPQCPPRPGHR